MLNPLDDELRRLPSDDGPGGPDPSRDTTAVAEAHVQPWELVEAGRYMPRRIRGSYRGRELG